MLFDHESFDDHETVVFAKDEASGLSAIIALHSTALGPAAGGTRLWHYRDDREALGDVLRLSHGMTYKNAMAGLPLGGGKTVVMAPETIRDRQALFAALGRAIDRLGGAYWTAEDVGVGPADMAVVASQTRYVAGLEAGRFASGDPSPVTARGVFTSLLAGAQHLWGAKDLNGRTAAVQGLGHVGQHLCHYLYAAGAKLIVSDLNSARAQEIAKRYGAQVVAPTEIMQVEMDIFVPCALGGVLTDESVTALSAKLICGAANNQLAGPAVAATLARQGKLYLPDYVVNAGGIISVASEILQIADHSWVEGKLDGLGSTIREILIEAEKGDGNTAAVADAIARQRISSKQRLAA